MQYSPHCNTNSLAELILFIRRINLKSRHLPFGAVYFSHSGSILNQEALDIISFYEQVSQA